MSTRETVSEYFQRGGAIQRIPTYQPPDTRPSVRVRRSRSTRDNHLTQTPRRDASQPHYETPTTRTITAADIHNNPPDVLAVWKQLNKQLLNDDRCGMWFAFSIATDLNPYSLQRHLLLRAHTASRLCGLTEFNTSPTRLKHRGCCAFLLPATSHAGFPHYHGMVRVPREYGITEKVMCIREEGKDVLIVVPESVRSFLTSPPFATLNVHVLNEDVCDALPRAVPLHEHPDVASRRALDYWTHRSDGEVRHFDEAEWLPWNVRKVLPNADTTKQGLW